MRAVGMDGRQLSKMILAEAFTYAFWGAASLACAIGLPFSKMMYDFLITNPIPLCVLEPACRVTGPSSSCCHCRGGACRLFSGKTDTNHLVTETINEL